jgi:hypothetical protein
MYFLFHNEYQFSKGSKIKPFFELKPCVLKIKKYPIRHCKWDINFVTSAVQISIYFMEVAYGALIEQETDF